MKKVLLINPPETGMGERSSPPLGLLYLAGILQRNNISVEIADGYILGWEGVQKELEQYKPNIIGIVCHTYARAKALEVAKIVRRISPYSLIVFGGAHPTIMCQQLLENYHFIDIAVIGEGDYTFLEICQGNDLKGIKGIAYRENSRVIINPPREAIKDLNSLPFPAWKLIDKDISKYPPDGEGIYRGINLEIVPRMPILFSRGCIGNCNFCSNQLTWKRWRHRSAKNMVDELEFLSKELNVKRLFFCDDLFTANKKATLDLCNEIILRKLNIVFDATTRADCVDLERLKALKEAGCYKIDYGIESASSKILKEMGKPIDVNITKEIIKLTKRVGIKVNVLLIVGNVGETRQTINETIDFLNEVQPDNVSIANGLMIYPGTRLYKLAQNLGFIDDDFWLSDYNWKVYTCENSKLRLNVFCNAINKRKKLSKFELINIIHHHRFYSRVWGDKLKQILSKLGFQRKRRPGKYKIAH